MLPGGPALLPDGAVAGATIKSDREPGLVNAHVQSSGMYSITVKVTTDVSTADVVHVRVGDVSHRVWKAAGTYTLTLKARVMVHGHHLTVSASAKNASASVAVSWRQVERQSDATPTPRTQHASATSAPTNTAPVAALAHPSIPSGPAVSTTSSAGAPTGTTGGTGTASGTGTTGGSGTTSGTGTPGGTATTSSSTTGVHPNAPISVGALAFADEFNSPETWGATWSQMRGNHWTMNNVSTDPSNVWITGGALNLRLASSSVGGYVATCKSDGGGGFTMGYGYAEARVLLPVSNGQIVGWPAWWIVGNNWPADGEADVVEGLGGSATSNYHSNSGSDNSGALAGNWYDGGWHTYGVNRQPGHNDIYWDGKLVRSYPTYDNGASECLILNIGSGPGPTVNGATMQVDYVRVWSG